MVKLQIFLNDLSGKLDMSTIKQLHKEYSSYTNSNVRVFEKDNVYTFNVDMVIDETIDIDDLASIAFEYVTEDFIFELSSDELDMVEVECDDELYQEPECLPSLHSKWVQDQIDDGWRYGTEYIEESKTNPYLVPFHQLSKRQKKKVGITPVGVYGFLGGYNYSDDEDDSGSDYGSYDVGSGDGGGE